MNGPRRLRIAATLLLLAALAGCTQQPRIPAVPPEWQAHAAAVAARAQWQLTGKIGIRSPRTTGSAFITWQQHDDAYRLVMSGALGLGKLVLSGDADGVTWTDSHGRNVHRRDPDALIAQAWGWHVPVRALRYWAQGIPAPDAPVDQLRLQDGTAAGFVQSGWTLQFERYGNSAGVALPGRIRLIRDDVALTLVVSRWSSAP